MCRNQNPANVRQRFLAWYERHLARFNLRDTTTDLCNLCLLDVWRSSSLQRMVSRYGHYELSHSPSNSQRSRYWSSGSVNFRMVLSTWARPARPGALSHCW